MSQPIVFRGPGAAETGDVQRAEEALATLRLAAKRIIDQFGPGALMDGLMSLYLDLSLRSAGEARTDETLRLIRRDLPRMAAALRAADNPKEGGHA